MFVGFAVIACTGTTVSSQEDNVEKTGVCQINTPDPRACDPADTSKTTVCHIPPGNPANAHTICVGNAAVPAHLDHGDFLGTCICEGSGSDGSDGSDGSASGSDGSASGSDGSASGSDGSASSGSGSAVVLM